MHQVVLQNPAAAVPDGDGGFLRTWSDLTPRTMHVAITRATQSDLERTIPVGTSITTATHLIWSLFHPQVTTKTRLLFGARVFEVISVTNVDERSRECLLVCVEVQP